MYFCNGCSPPDPGPDGGCDFVFCQVPNVVVYVFCNCFGSGNNNMTMKHFHCIDNLPYILIWRSWAMLPIACCHMVLSVNSVLDASGLDASSVDAYHGPKHRCSLRLCYCGDPSAGCPKKKLAYMAGC